MASSASKSGKEALKDSNTQIMRNKTCPPPEVKAYLKVAMIRDVSSA